MKADALKINSSIPYEMDQGVAIGEAIGVWMQTVQRKIAAVADEFGRWVDAWTVTDRRIDLPRPRG